MNTKEQAFWRGFIKASGWLGDVAGALGDVTGMNGLGPLDLNNLKTDFSNTNATNADLSAAMGKYDKQYLDPYISGIKGVADTWPDTTNSVANIKQQFPSITDKAVFKKLWPLVKPRVTPFWDQMSKQLTVTGKGAYKTMGGLDAEDTLKSMIAGHHPFEDNPALIRYLGLNMDKVTKPYFPAPVHSAVTSTNAPPSLASVPFASK